MTNFADELHDELLQKQAFQGHTPGPWRVVQHNHADGDLWLSVNQEVEVNEIKAGAEWVAEIKYLTTDQERQWANARLIAAAPEMLEALKELEAARMETYEPARTWKAVDKARAAVAKAEGRDVSAPPYTREMAQRDEAERYRRDHR